MPSPSLSDYTNEAKQDHHPPPPHDSFNKAYRPKKGRERRKQIKITENHRMKEKKKQKQKKRRQRKTTFEPASPVGGTSSMVMFYFVVGLVPRSLDCHFHRTFVQPLFPLYSSYSSPSPRSLGRVFCHSSCCPLHPLLPWALPTVDARRCLLISASASCHLTIYRSAASRIPRNRFPGFLTTVGHSAV